MTTFTGNNVRWPYRRAIRPFVVRVVEPALYSPAAHTEMFNAVLGELLTPAAPSLDPFDTGDRAPAQRAFDLVTFPEAFVPAAALISALSAMQAIGSFGCVHVGLRPSGEDANHLFSVAQVRELVVGIRGVRGLVSQDLDLFSSWVERQGAHKRFNIGCVFLVDANNRLRVCLFPKMVRAGVEASPLPEHHMHEADLLTLITLEPTDTEFSAITLQPLLCSDALNLPTDRPGATPLIAANRNADCLGASPPNHVDIVTVATCTRQPKGLSNDGTSYRQWHEQFLDTFRALAISPEFRRHHFSAVVLANFTSIEMDDDTVLEGGVSGSFLPVPPQHSSFHPDVAVCCWGRSKMAKGVNTWSKPDDNAQTQWESKGFVAGLNPYVLSRDAVVRIFGFTIQRLPRENSLWTGYESLTQCEVTIGQRQSDNSISFSMVNANAAG